MWETKMERDHFLLFDNSIINLKYLKIIKCEDYDDVFTINFKFINDDEDEEFNFINKQFRDESFKKLQEILFKNKCN